MDGLLPPAVPQVRTSSGDQAAEYIRELIFNGVLRPGSRVPQDQIAQSLGVSRIPIREALIALERDGWVTIELHRGAFVNSLDAQTVQDHYDLYGLVYGLAAQRALTRSADDLVAALSPIAKSMKDTEDPSEFTKLAFAFNSALVHAAHSPRIRVVVRALSGMVPGDFFSLVPSAMPIERRGLAAILRALKKGDGAEAAAEYARMMQRVGREVVQLFEARGLFEVPADTRA